jgi:hypothetical protein
MLILTYYWMIATVIYLGATATVAWASWSLEFSFAFVLGQLFIWLALVSVGCWAIVRWGLEREKEWWNNAGGDSGVSESQDRPVDTSNITRSQEERGHRA